MGNVFDYLKKYGNSSFEEFPFCEADVIVLAQLSYLKFDGVIPQVEEAAPAVTLRQIDERMDPEIVFADKWYEKPNRQLWKALQESSRYRDMECSYYYSVLEAENETQFGAVTFFPQGCMPMVAFRGTDGTVVGWKEDFNMAFKKVLPGQEMSVAYLNEVGARLPGDFLVCGHSKGGNLAVYSSTCAEIAVQEKIKCVYCLDGPGFLPDVLPKDGYERIQDKVCRILPYSSMVGMLLQNFERYEVTKSSAFGVGQHDLYTWQMENGLLERAQDIQAMQKHINEALNQWIFALSEEERERFVTTLFAMLAETGVSTVSEFVGDWKKNLKICMDFMKNLDEDTGKYLRRTIRVMIDIYAGVMQETVKQDMDAKREQVKQDVETKKEAMKHSMEAKRAEWEEKSSFTSM